MNSFSSRAVLKSGDRSYTIFRLPALTGRGFGLSRLPFSLKILLENLLRREDGVNVTASDIDLLRDQGRAGKAAAFLAFGEVAASVDAKFCRRGIEIGLQHELARRRRRSVTLPCGLVYFRPLSTALIRG